ncbi:MAG: response regulator [bacterium]
MGSSVLSGKRILLVDDEPDVLDSLTDIITESVKDCTVETASSYDEAIQRLSGWTYDLVVLDIMGVNGFDLLERAVARKLPVAMLTAHALSPEALKKSFEMGARAYLPKEMMPEIVGFLEDVLSYEYLPGWKRLLEKLEGFFNRKFETDWEKKTGLHWREWAKH